MNRRLKKILTGFVLVCSAIVLMPFGRLTAFAGSAKISFNDPNASVGQEFNVTVKIAATDGELGSADVMLSYDPAYIEFVSGNDASGGAGSLRLVGTMDSDTATEFNYNLKFKAVQAGNSAISVANYEVYDKDTQTVEVSKVGSSKVKVAAPSSSSKEAGLSSIKVSPGSLSPAFSSDVTAYTVNVGRDVSKLTVNAVAKDGKAKVAVSGNSNLKTGANSVVCKVTAEDGQTVKTYKITVNKSESGETESQAAETALQTQGAVIGDLKADVDGVQYGVAVSFDPSLLPEGYTQSTCNYGGTQIMSGSGNDITLIYLQDSTGAGELYIYNEESGALSPYATIDVAAKSIIVLPLDESVTAPEGLVETMIRLSGNHQVKGWVWQNDGEQKYCVVYGMNENGDKGLYRYDIAERTFQRYFEDPVVKSGYDDAEVETLLSEYTALQKDYNLRFFIMVGLIVICLILFFIIVNMLLKRRERTYGGNDRREEAPTPTKRRAAEQERKAKLESREMRSSRRYESDAEYEEREPKRAEEPRRRQELDVYQTRSSSEPRSNREPVRQNSVGTQGEEESFRGGRSYTIRHEEDGFEESRRSRNVRDERPRFQEGTAEVYLQRAKEREERARIARERLEQERREDERRRYGRPERQPEKKVRQDDDDDFEFIDLD